MSASGTFWTSFFDGFSVEGIFGDLRIPGMPTRMFAPEPERKPERKPEWKAGNGSEAFPFVYLLPWSGIEITVKGLSHYDSEFLAGVLDSAIRERESVRAKDSDQDIQERYRAG